jgi:5-methylcytosine-specific restriction endonuclease McrA
MANQVNTCASCGKTKKTSIGELCKSCVSRKFGEDSNNWKGGLPFCRECGKTLSRRDAEFCLEHRPRHGIHSTNWKGGISKLGHSIRSLKKYKEWRSDVLERDSWTCQSCGRRGVVMETHHINKFSEIVIANKIAKVSQAVLCEELWDVSNGVTLCVDCHRTTKRKKDDK